MESAVVRISDQHMGPSSTTTTAVYQAADRNKAPSYGLPPDRDPSDDKPWPRHEFSLFFEMVNT